MVNKKKAGVITLHGANNYGAVYQVYALTRYVESLGFEVFVLNYRMEKNKLRKCMLKPISLFRKMLSRNAFSLNFLNQRKQYYQGKQREKGFYVAFEDFRAKYLNVVGKECDYDDLTNDCPEAYAFITGSDQVWAADFLFTSPAYLLGFAPKGAKRISYAPSFGKSQLEPYLRSTFKRYIEKFDAISVRENSGVDIVSDVANLDAVKVVDPTLLLTDYSEITDYSLAPSEPYILVYRLNQERELAEWMVDSIKAVAQSTGLPLVAVSTNCPWGLGVGGSDLQPTPEQLLGLVDRAALVLTNSFHGTVFSLLFRSKFLTFARDRFENKQNLRMTELLGSVGLIDTFCGPFIDVESVVEKSKLGVDFEDAHTHLERARSVSVNYLSGALL